MGAQSATAKTKIKSQHKKPNNKTVSKKKHSLRNTNLSAPLGPPEKEKINSNSNNKKEESSSGASTSLKVELEDKKQKAPTAKRIPSPKATKVLSYTTKVKVQLGDGRHVSGRIRLKVPPTLRLEHSKNDIDYYKDIRMEDVTALEIKAWQSKYIRRRPVGEIYHFEVARYIIHLENGQSLLHIGALFPFLQSFTVQNANGNVRLYAYWVDLLKKDKTWHTGMKGPVSGERVLAHKDVVHKIFFEKL